jgi:hypothetical protein
MSSQDVITQINQLRASRKKVDQFSTVAEWLAYNKSYAEQMNQLMSSLEKTCK